MLLADKIRKIIAGNYYGSVGTVTCSIGISSFHDEDSKESMTERQTAPWTWQKMQDATGSHTAALPMINSNETNVRLNKPPCF